MAPLVAFLKIFKVWNQNKIIFLDENKKNFAEKSMAKQSDYPASV